MQTMYLVVFLNRMAVPSNIITKMLSILMVDQW